MCVCCGVTGYSLPPHQTTRTGPSNEAAALKYTAEPPRASVTSPNGVEIESSATLPTTSRLISHPIRCGDAEQREAVAQHDAGGTGEGKARRLGGRRFAEDAALVVPAVGEASQVFQVVGDPVGLPHSRGLDHDFGVDRELLEQLEV